MQYDYLIVGAGLFGEVFIYEAKKRNKMSGYSKAFSYRLNIYMEDIEAINVHKYGAHAYKWLLYFRVCESIC